MSDDKEMPDRLFILDHTSIATDALFCASWRPHNPTDICFIKLTPERERAGEIKTALRVTLRHMPDQHPLIPDIEQLLAEIDQSEP